MMSPHSDRMDLKGINQVNVILYNNLCINNL